LSSDRRSPDRSYVQVSEHDQSQCGASDSVGYGRDLLPAPASKILRSPASRISRNTCLRCHRELKWLLRHFSPTPSDPPGPFLLRSQRCPGGIRPSLSALLQLCSDCSSRHRSGAISETQSTVRQGTTLATLVCTGIGSTPSSTGARLLTIRCGVRRSERGGTR